MNEFKTLALTLSETQTAELTALYDQMQHTMERRYFLPSEQYDKLRAAMRKTLEAQEGWIAIEKQADSHHTLLRLTSADNRLLNLPWRLAVAHDARLYLSCDVQEAREGGIFEPQTASPLKILVMVSAPDDSHGGARLDYETEEKKIIEAFSPLFRHGQVQIDFTDDGSLESLEAKLKANRYHILHFSGHGVFDAEGQMGEKKPNTGYLLLEDARTLGSQLVSARAFARAISVRSDQCPDLVLLSSCQTAQGGASEGGFTGVANKLLNAGVPAVVAMGFSILDPFASLFAAELYRQLAEKEELPQSFHLALNHLRGAEADFARQGGGLPSQWLIPQLYLRQQVNKLVNWTAPDQKLVFKSAKFATGEARLLLEERKGYLFIGRRRERRDAQRHLSGEGKAVLLRGMGGVGKTALAEHLLGRLVAHDPRVQPFVINEKDQSSLEALMKQMQDYIEPNDFLITSQTARYEKAEDQLRFLLSELRKYCQPVFLFDNLESFQSGPGEAFKPEHSDVFELLQLLLHIQAFPLILTGRYPLQEFPDLPVVDLNTVRSTDFYRKCLQMGFASLLKRPLPHARRTDARPVSFDELVSLLHQTLGGNYRALEFFDELFLAKQQEILPTLDKLEDFRQKLAEEHAPALRERLNTGARTLIFEELYGLLNNEAQQTLQLLAGFRVPVLPMALTLQGIDSGPQPALDRLRNLTLIERHPQPTDGEDLIFWYVPPLVRDFLKAQAAPVAFEHAQAGCYFEHVAMYISETSWDWEVAFWHYFQIKAAEKVNKIGETLNTVFYENQLFKKSLQYGLWTDRICGKNTFPAILGNIGLVLNMNGESKHGLSFLERALMRFRAMGSREGESVVLNNICQNDIVRGNYETAMNRAKESLKICQETGFQKGEASALNIMGQIYHTKGNYDNAFRCWSQSLAISLELGDKEGEAIANINVSQIFAAKGEHGTELTYLKRSLEISQENNYRHAEVGALINLGKAYGDQCDYDTALQYFDQGLQIGLEIGDRKSEAATLNFIAGIYRAQGDYNSAWEYLSKSLHIKRKIGDPLDVSSVLNNMGLIILEHQRKPEDALPLFLEAYSILKQLDLPQAESIEKVLNAITNQIGIIRVNEISEEYGFGYKVKAFNSSTDTDKG